MLAISVPDLLDGLIPVLGKEHLLGKEVASSCNTQYLQYDLNLIEQHHSSCTQGANRQASLCQSWL